MENKNTSSFAVVVREEDTQELLLKEIFPKIEEAQDRKRELLETSQPEGIPTQVDIEPQSREEGDK